MHGLDTGMYIVDTDYCLRHFNHATKEMYPEVRVGAHCYECIALRNSPCVHCPLRTKSVTFYQVARKEWISANSAAVDMPGFEGCYCVQFQANSCDSVEMVEFASLDKMEACVGALQEATGMECAMGAYCEPGSPMCFVNPAMVEFLGYDSKEELMQMINDMAGNLVHPDDRNRVRKDLETFYATGSNFEISYRMPRKDGSWIWIVSLGRIIEVESGRRITVCVCSEMGEFLKHHERLRESNQNLVHKDIVAEAMIQNIPGGYHRCSVEEGYPFQYVGDSFLDILGWTREEIVSEFDNKFINMVVPEDIDLVEELVATLPHKNMGSHIYRMYHKDGGYRWIQDSTLLVELGTECFYQGAISDVTDYIEEMRRQQRALEDAKYHAEASNRAKSVFLFNASHDIRTPMNAIMGFADIIEQNPGDEVLVRDVIGKIQKSSDTLMKLLNDVLEISRIESGKDEPDTSVLDLKELLDKLYLMFSQEISDKGVHLQMHSELKDSCVWCDELKCMRIMMNMLSNAKKFTQAGGAIEFGVQQLSRERDMAEYRFYVLDTGIGMSKEFQKRAFEQFERAKSSTDSGITGSGLGLAIIKKLVEQMEGSYTLDSELGIGTEISVILRLRVAEEKAEVSEPAVAELEDMIGKRVLLVEDNEFNREIAGYVLENAGLLVEEAENGAEAVHKLAQSEPGYYNLVLMDIQMPIMDGITATGEIRRLPKSEIANVPIIAMTANAFKEDREKCMNAGMNGHLGKPIEVQKLVELLTLHLK